MSLMKLQSFTRFFINNVNLGSWITTAFQTPKGYLDDVISSHFEKIQSAIRATFVKANFPGFADVCGSTKEEMKVQTTQLLLS